MGIVSGLAHILSQLCLDVPSLLIIDPFDILWKPRNDEVPYEGNHARENAFDYENPSPAAVASQASHLSETAS